jgi:hypothetical protein
MGLFFAVWIYPLIRLAQTLKTVLAADSEDQSINSSNDVRWNIMVSIGYLFCIVAGATSTWFIKSGKPSSWIGYISAILAGIFFCLMPFDGVIVHIVQPPLPIAAGLLCLICMGITWFCNSRPEGKKFSA